MENALTENVNHSRKTNLIALAFLMPAEMHSQNEPSVWCRSRVPHQSESVREDAQEKLETYDELVAFSVFILNEIRPDHRVLVDLLEVIFSEYCSPFMTRLVRTGRKNEKFRNE